MSEIMVSKGPSRTVIYKNGKTANSSAETMSGDKI
jgi:hypothetical protein